MLVKGRTSQNSAYQKKFYNRGMGDVKITPSTTEGPYYKENSPERTNLREDGIPGQELSVSGYVLDDSGKPLPSAWLDFWQANGNGNYDNVGFKLRGHQYADGSGYYVLQTVVPGGYPARTPHIHVKVRSPNNRVTLTTQLFFPGMSTNETDPIFRKELLLNVPGGIQSKTATFNFVLGSH